MPRGDHKIRPGGGGRTRPLRASRKVIWNSFPTEGEYDENGVAGYENILSNEDDLTGFTLTGADRTIQYGMVKDRTDRAEMDEELVYRGEMVSSEAAERFGDDVE